MTEAKDNTPNRTAAGFFLAALALSLLWCLPAAWHLLGGDLSAGALHRLASRAGLPLELLALAAPLVLLWSAVLLAFCLTELRAGARQLADAAARLSGPGTQAQTQEERRLQEQLLQARQESAALARALGEEWRATAALLERLHEQGRRLRENSEEIEGVLRETAAALPQVMERNLAQLGQHLEDSREQIGILIRLRAEQEAALSRGLAAVREQTRRLREAAAGAPREAARDGEIARWIASLGCLDIVARLGAMTPDIDAALAHSPSPGLWRRRRQGEGGLFSPRDYGPGGLELYRQAVDACGRDKAFRARVDVHLDRFEALLQGLQPDEQDACLASREGRVYLLLAQARGRLD